MTTARRHWRALAALLCAGLAVLLVLLALDVRTWQTTVARDDLRFRALRGHVGLWRPATVLPGDPAGSLLGVGDALDYRHALQLFWYSRVGADPQTRTDLPTTRVQAEETLQRLIENGRTGHERSAAANLLGVLVVSTPNPNDRKSQSQTLQRAATIFQQAIRLDSANYDAKLNLEVVLRLRRPGKSRFGADARGGYGFGRGRGVGVIGSGY